jgi:hypothetical protein
MFATSLEPGNHLLITSGATSYADRLFWRRYAAARLHAFASRLLGRQDRLRPLALARQGTFVKSRRYAGVQLIALASIRGSESRSADFDAAFRPRHRRMHQRWVSVATAWLNGVVFEPVQLIQIGNDYFVRDGHHRISVAHTVGQRYIDAEVTVLELGEPAANGRRAAVRSPAIKLGALVPVF